MRMNNRINYLIPKELSMSSGIYRITTPDGHYYIGSTNCFKHRYKEHYSTLRTKSSMNPHMVNRFHSSDDVWSFELVEEVPVDQLLTVEQRYLDQHHGNQMCMNINPCAIKPPNRKGCKFTDEQRARLKGRVMKDRAAWVEKLRITSTGRKYSEQTRAKISAAHKGKPKSLEHRAKISATLKGNIPWNKGTKYDASFLVGRQFGAKSTCGCPYKGGTNEYHKWRMANDTKYRESRRLQNQRAKAKRKSAALKYS